MSGDCGHGWMHHDKGRDKPCQKCYAEWLEAKNELVELEALKTITPALGARRDRLRKLVDHLSSNW